MKKIYFLYISLIFCLLEINQSDAQKQPKTQEVSIRAPANIKVDGELNEWKNKLLNAYNPNNRIYYLVANDDENLYFVIRGLGTRVAVKTLRAGITITISSSLDKKIRVKAVDNVSLTFPMPLNDSVTTYVMHPLRQSTDFKDNTSENKKQIDSLVLIANTRITSVLKEIGIKGIKDIKDTSISIYNESGIKAMGRFDKNKTPIYELAIPLKYLSFFNHNPATFSYCIRLNGRQSKVGVAVNPDTGAPDIDSYYVEYPTELWSEYTLAKKRELIH